MLYTDDFLRGCPSGKQGSAWNACVVCVLCLVSAAKDKLKITSAMVYEFFSDSVIVLVKHLSVM